jgi:hypothetical protein
MFMHEHHFDACAAFDGMSDGGGFLHEGSVGKPHGATIVFQRWTDLHINYILGNSGSITPPSSWQIALSTTAVSAMARNSAISATITGTNVNELASTTAAGYARQAVARTINQAGIDWGTSSFDNTLSTGGTSSTADQVTFSFTGTPSPQGANSWFMGDGTSLNAGQIYVAADMAATRNFANGDTEKVTATIKSG